MTRLLTTLRNSTLSALCILGASQQVSAATTTTVKTHPVKTLVLCIMKDDTSFTVFMSTAPVMLIPLLLVVGPVPTEAAPLPDKPT